MKFIAVDDKLAEALNDGFIPLKDILSDIDDCKHDLARSARNDWHSTMVKEARWAIEYLIRRLDNHVKKAQLRGHRPKADKTNTRTRNYYKF